LRLLNAVIDRFPATIPSDLLLIQFFPAIDLGLIKG